MITAIAIDDEPTALDIISMHAAKTKNLDLRATFEDAMEAMEFIRINPVQLVFLDINMPFISGMEVAALLLNGPKVIFTTAYSQYAVQSYEVDAAGYLLKPINLERFQAAFLAASHIIATQEKAARADKQEKIAVHDGTSVLHISITEILYLKAEDNYTNIIMPDRSILTRCSIDNLLQKLPDQFRRVHRSWAVNLEKIEKAHPREITIAGMQIPVSKTFRNVIKPA